MRRRMAIMGAATVGAVVAATFAITTATAPTAAAAELTPFQDCSQLRDWYVEAALPSVTAWGWGGGVRIYAAEAAGGVNAPVAKDAQSNSATGTNVQEAGVDEPDYVKTNGRLLVRIVGSNRLVVTDVSGSSPRELGRVDFPDDMYGGEMLLVGDRVVVSGGTNASAQSGGPTDGPIPRDMMGTLVPFHYQGAESRILTISISDPRHPTVVSDRRIDGSILTMRQYGDNVRVVLTSSYPDLDFIYPSKKVTEKQALAHNQQAVRDSAISDWLPAIRQSAKDPGTPLVSCTDVSHPKKQSGFGTITVAAFPAANIDDLRSVAVTAGGQLVYSSADRLYLATTSWGWAMPLGIAVPDVGVAEAPDAAPGSQDGTARDTVTEKPAATTSVTVAASGAGGGSVPPPDQPADDPATTGTGDTEPGSGGGGADSGPAAKTGGAAGIRAPEPITTQIHAFALDGLDTTYLGSGQVKGQIRDRWSMSEYDGDLRVAVGLGQPWNTSDNGVVVLRDQGGKLVQVGSVRGLGIDEQIQSVRWLGSLAVVVTFRQVDPLYTIDLSDPTKPVVLGALKIPGFSSYLHPIGDGMLVGIGQDATQAGRTKGGQAAVFDISSPADPSRLSTFSFGRNSQPTAGWEPRSFTYLPDSHTLLTSAWNTRGQVTEFVLTVGADGSLTQSDAIAMGKGYAEQVRALPLSDGRVALVNGTLTTLVQVG